MNKLAASLLFVLLTACSSIGLQEAKTLDQRIAFAYGTNTALRDAAASAVVGKRLAVSDGEFVLKTTDQARTTLDAARMALGAGDTSTAEGRLVMVLGILTQVQAYLNSKGAQ